MASERLKINDLNDVLTKLKNADFDNTKWRALGGELGLKPGTCNEIDQNNPRDVNKCLYDCLAKWLERADNVDGKGIPTYNVLADALDNIGQKNQADYIRKSLGQTASKRFKTNEEAGGIEETDCGNAPPHWPDDADDFKYRPDEDEDFDNNFISGIKILLIPATPEEEKQVLRYLRPKDERSQKYIQTSIDDIIDVSIGKYGKNPVIVAMTAPGKGMQGPIHAAIVTTKILEKVQSIEYVVAVGVCFGMDCIKQNLGDVIVSSIICDFTNKREGTDDSSSYFRGAQPSAGSKIIRKFRPRNEILLPLQGIKIYCGPVISIPSLINNPVIKEELKSSRPDALAGEMEGAGITTAIGYTDSKKAEAIVIKGIGDWGDGNKEGSKEWKPYAARAAAYYVKTVLEEKSL